MQRQLGSGCIHVAPQRHLPYPRLIHRAIHQATNSNIVQLESNTFKVFLFYIYLRIFVAPSTDNRLRSLSNELALDTWSHMSSKRCQKYSQIFAVPYIVAALISLHSAIYRHSREIII